MKYQIQTPNQKAKTSDIPGVGCNGMRPGRIIRCLKDWFDPGKKVDQISKIGENERLELGYDFSPEPLISTWKIQSDLISEDKVHLKQTKINYKQEPVEIDASTFTIDAQWPPVSLNDITMFDALPGDELIDNIESEIRFNKG